MSDEPRTTGEVFTKHITGLRDLEFERMKTLEGRGALILRTDLAFLTAVAAIATFTIGRASPFYVSPITAVLAVVGVAAFVVSIVFAARVQAGTGKYMLTDDKTLDLMVGEKWAVSASEAGKTAAKRDVEFIQSIRPQNEERAGRLKKALGFQIAFILFFVLAGGIEIGNRVGAIDRLIAHFTT